MSSTSESTQLELSSANGPVFRRVSRADARDARPEEIPIIDMSSAFSSDLGERQHVANKIRDAAERIGFFYIKNHGVAAASIEELVTSALTFFRQSDAAKEKVNTAHFANFDGWKPAGTRRLNNTESVDKREAFSMGYDIELNDSLVVTDRNEISCINSFPWEHIADVPTFESSYSTYFKACLQLARLLTRLFALSLELAENYFDDKIAFPDADLAINYYPPLQDKAKAPRADEEEVSIGSHTDFQLFTILYQDNNGGLQILNSSGEWIKAVPIPGTFVVNIADYMQRITNDRYVSTVHRVQNFSGNERISVPLFWGFGKKEVCGVLDCCVKEERPARYEPISCEDWVRKRVENMTVADAS